jgi:hypothetical protein
MDGELRMEAAVERSTITSKPGVETLARTAISPRGGSRAHTKPRKRWVKAARALTFWTSLGLLFSIQVYLLWPEVGQ